MLDPWNDSSLLPPPVHTCPHPCIEFDVNDLSYICIAITQVLEKQSPLHEEAAILSRLVYKYDKKFRNDIGFRYLKKTNTVLRRYLMLNFIKDVENFSTNLPNNEDNYYPTRQMLEYVLVRLQTFTKLMLRICTCSKQACIFYLDRIKRGESHWMSLMPYAVLSRIWSMTTILLQHSGTWYTQLYPYLNKLQVKGLQFLPKHYELPKSIKDWVDVNNIGEVGQLKWSKNKYIDVKSFLNEVEENDDFDIFTFVNEINQDVNDVSSSLDNEPPNSITTHISRVPIMKQINQKDEGVKISRNSVNIPQLNVVQRCQQKEYTDIITKNELENNNECVHAIATVTSTKQLSKFILDEETYRNEDSDNSLTKHLSFMQWQALKSNLLDLSNSLSRNRKIEKKLKKLWKEKCTNYL